MLFEKFAQILYPICGDGLKNTGFVIRLVDSFMEDPSDELDIEKAENDEYNPFNNLQESTLRHYFNGTRSIPKKSANFILGHMDKLKFADYVDNFSQDALGLLCSELKKAGTETDRDRVGEVCADLMEQSLQMCVEAASTKPRTKDEQNTEFSQELLPELHGNNKAVADLTETFKTYMKNACDKYDKVKTLLYKNEPKSFYEFYVSNHCRSLAGENNEPLENVTAETILNVSNFIILVGPAGLGKSMMMRHLLLSAADNFETGRKIPVFLPLKDFGTTSVDIIDFIYNRINPLCDEITREAFIDSLSSGSYLFLLDGLDEIDVIHTDRFEREFEAFSDKYQSNAYVVSSRPIHSFVSFGRFTRIKLLPFNKEQALEFVDKSGYRPDAPELIKKFRNLLDKTLFKTHFTFAQNPLLLTIMILTFDVYADVPTRSHIFYRDAFLALAAKHDSTKTSFTRALKTKLDLQTMSEYLAEIGFRLYVDEKYEFTEDEFADYFGKMTTGYPLDSAMK